MSWRCCRRRSLRNNGRIRFTFITPVPPHVGGNPEQGRGSGQVSGGQIKIRPSRVPPTPRHPPPHCCGNGGGLSALYPELADRFLDRIVGEAEDRTMVTYCTGCQNRFLKRGVEVVHLLECLPGVKPRRKSRPPSRQWVNRLALAMVRASESSSLLSQDREKRRNPGENPKSPEIKHTMEPLPRFFYPLWSSVRSD